MYTDVAHENGILRQCLVDLMRGTLRIDRRRVVGKSGRYELVPFLAIGVDLGEPFLPCVGPLREIGAPVELPMNLTKEGADIRHQAECNRIVTADLLGIDIDVNETRRWNRERVTGYPRA